MPTPPRQPDAPLYVDLDGTLLRTDMLGESLAALARQRPWDLPLVPLWLLRGRAAMKRQIARRVVIDPALLPYRADVVEYLRQQKQAGRRVVLATGSDALPGQAVADHVGLFDAVLGSDGSVNLKGVRKLAAIEADALAVTGSKSFAYIGDARADAPIWAASAEPMVVTRSRAVTRRLLRARGESVRRFDGDVRSSRGGTSLLRAMRPHQWTKNLLLLAPVALSHQLGNAALVVAAALGLIAFSLCASSVYLVNDLLDLAADRAHPTKRHRPIAAGRLSIAAASASAALLLAGAVALAWALPRPFLVVLGVYWLTTMIYSLLLKRLVVVDVMTLAGLYTLRLWAGGAATGVWISPWLIAFSLCIFVSLALLKRYIELRVAAAAAMAWPATRAGAASRQLGGRGYVLSDRRTVAWFGIGAGAASTLVMAAYVNSAAVAKLYASPTWLLLVCPLLLAWIARIWWLARDDKVADDPVLYALRDWSSYAIGTGIVVVGMLAKLG